jgi:hypothetical protein
MVKPPKKAKNAKRAVWGPYGQQRAPQHQVNSSCGAQGPHVVPWHPQSAMDGRDTTAQCTLACASACYCLAAMMADNVSAYSTHTGSRGPVPPVHYVGIQRPFYCFVHGANTSHPVTVCKVMAQDSRYTSDMKVATSATTGGNPNMGPPVTFHRSPVAVLSSTNACLPCAMSSLQGHAKREAPPYDESVSAGLAIRAQARIIRGANRLSRARAAEQSCLALELTDLSCPQCVLPDVSFSIVPGVSVSPPAGPESLPQAIAPTHTHMTPQQPRKLVSWSSPLLPNPSPLCLCSRHCGLALSLLIRSLVSSQSPRTLMARTIRILFPSHRTLVTI